MQGVCMTGRGIRHSGLTDRVIWTECARVNGLNTAGTPETAQAPGSAKASGCAVPPILFLDCPIVRGGEDQESSFHSLTTVELGVLPAEGYDSRIGELV